MRTVFLGSPPFATPVLERVIDSPFRPVLVVTPPDRSRGRGRKVEPNAVAELARASGIEVLQPESVRDEALLERLRAEEADVFLVVSYGELLREEFLDLARVVPLNVHPSLLPRHRGATPIQAAILAGDDETGVSIQKVVRELDAGDVLVARREPIRPGETAGELSARLAALSGDVLVEALERLDAGTAELLPQDPERVTFCRKLTKDSGVIDWSLEPIELERHVRAMNPWPLARTTLPNGKPLGVHRVRVLDGRTDAAGGTVLEAKDALRVAAGGGVVELLEVQAAGKRPLDAAAFLRGARLEPGERFA